MAASTDRAPIRPSDIDARQRRALKTCNSWRRFHNGPRKRPEPLLKALGSYPDCVLVAGCQRSGTTMLTRIIAHARQFRPLQLTHDDELDAALALAGFVDLPRDTRYCFQTTYLNERYPEYKNIGPGQRLIWVVRNPHSVVYSMMHNWRRFALDELYEACGIERANTRRLRRSGLPWPFGPSLAERACLSYSAKTSQILAIRQMVPSRQLLTVDYDQLVRSPREWLPRVFAFIGEPYDDVYAAAVRADSVHKADRLSPRARRLVEERALPTYRECAV